MAAVSKRVLYQDGRGAESHGLADAFQRNGVAPRGGRAAQGRDMGRTRAFGRHRGRKKVYGATDVFLAVVGVRRGVEYDFGRMVEAAARGAQVAVGRLRMGRELAVPAAEVLLLGAGPHRHAFARHGGHGGCHRGEKVCCKQQQRYDESSGFHLCFGAAGCCRGPMSVRRLRTRRNGRFVPSDANVGKILQTAQFFLPL